VLGAAVPAGNEGMSASATALAKHACEKKSKVRAQNRFIRLSQRQDAGGRDSTLLLNRLLLPCVLNFEFIYLQLTFKGATMALTFVRTRLILLDRKWRRLDPLEWRLASPDLNVDVEPIAKKANILYEICEDSRVLFLNK